ncbi:MAG: hypothetical protein AB7S74_19250 [Hyphomicrobium sp.]
MSEDVFAKLNSLHDEVRTRIEATLDWKALMAVERALNEVRGLLPTAAEEQPQVADEAVLPMEAEAVAQVEEADEPPGLVAEAPVEAEAAPNKESEMAIEEASSAETKAEESDTGAEALNATPPIEIPEEHKVVLEEIVLSEQPASEASSATI